MSEFWVPIKARGTKTAVFPPGRPDVSVCVGCVVPRSYVLLDGQTSLYSMLSGIQTKGMSRVLTRTGLVFGSAAC